jgi:uncharacterized protein YlxW (UPF0749 family)
MNLLGKVFTVLIFIMSLVFMSFAVAVFATHTNWKDKAVNTLKPELNKAQQVNQDLQAEIEQLKNALAKERAARVNVLAALETKLLQLQQQLTLKEEEATKLEAALQVLTETNDSTQDTLTALTNEVETLRAEIKTTIQDRDAQFEAVVALTDQLNQARGEQSRIAERNEQLIAQNAAMENILDKNGLTPETPVSHIPPRLNGMILEASGGDLLEVSLGSDDGLKKGHQLEVFRGPQYLGRVEVVSTKPDVAVTRILKPYHRAPIKRGDSVRTKVD